MLQAINTYLIIGLLWLLLHELFSIPMNNGMRFRIWIFWPVTLIAWIIGFIQAWINHDR
jgi:hypothetical protein